MSATPAWDSIKKMDCSTRLNMLNTSMPWKSTNYYESTSSFERQLVGVPQPVIAVIGIWGLCVELVPATPERWPSQPSY